MERHRSTTLAPLYIAVFASMATVCPSIAQTKSTLTKEAKIEEIISRMHLVDSMKDGFERTMPTMVDVYTKRNPNITGNQTAEILKVIRKSIVDLEPSLKNMYVEIYDSQLNDEQVDVLYTFYSTPIGAEIAAKQQDIAKAGALQAGTWGRSIWAPDLKKRLESDEALKGLNF